MISLVFDTETTGAATRDDPTDEKTSKPVQLFAAMFEHDPDVDYFVTRDDGQKFLNLRPIQMLNTLVYLPEGLEIHPKAQEVHGISAERSRQFGASPDFVSGILADWMDAADMLVAHNINFDRKIVAHMFHQSGVDPKIVNKPRHFCTMEYLKPIMQMTPRYYGDWKMPKLIEAYRYLFQRDFDGPAHDASVDSLACADIYFEIGNMERNKLKAS